MKFCLHCGKEIMDEAVICPGCGCVVSGEVVINKEAVAGNKTSYFGWGVLGFFIPVVGLILYFVNRTKNPARAKALGIATLIGFGFVVLCCAIVLILSALSALEEAKFAALYPNIYRLYH